MVLPINRFDKVKRNFEKNTKEAARIMDGTRMDMFIRGYSMLRAWT